MSAAGSSTTSSGLVVTSPRSQVDRALAVRVPYEDAAQFHFGAIGTGPGRAFVEGRRDGRPDHTEPEKPYADMAGSFALVAGPVRHCDWNPAPNPPRPGIPCSGVGVGLMDAMATCLFTQA